MHPGTAERIVLRIDEMLEYHHRVRVHGLDVLAVACEYVDTLLVIRAVLSAVVGESLGEVEAETVNSVLAQQICETPAYVFRDDRVLVVYILEYPETVRSHDIVVRVERGDIVFGRVPIESRIRMCTGCVVVNYVHQYGESPLVALVDKLAVHLAGTVSLVECKV